MIIGSEVQGEEENVKLVVVDSMISHFRGEYVDRENLAERQQKLNQSCTSCFG